MGLFLTVDRERAISRALPFTGNGQAQGSVRGVRGFTLIELMITAAIVAILAAVAYPSYTSHLLKARRAAAQSHLMDLAQKQTQFLLDNRAYGATAAALSATTPTDVNTYYTITFDVQAGPPPSFIISAQPKAGTPQASDSTLTINQAGQKSPPDKW